MKKRTFYLTIPIVLFAVAIGCFLWQFETAQALRLDLTATREKAYFSALDGLSNLETDLGKVLISQSPGQNALLLGRVSSIAIGVSENLASLPAAYGADADGLKFLTQTADYAQSLASAAAEGHIPNEKDLEQLGVLREKSAELFTHLQNGAGFSYDKLQTLEKATGIDYPSLLYDGPFSDGKKLGMAKGLTGGQITEDEAVKIAAAFIGNERVLSLERAVDTGGPVPTYGVALKLPDASLTVNVTRQGGKILWMTSETAGFTPDLDIDECVLHAKAFLTSRGFGEMRESYVQQYDGIAVINFAAAQNDVILYPDLVKVQVRMDTGAVIGIEANNYWMNHVTRERLHPLLTESEAKTRVSDRLAVSGARLCVIPLEDGLGAGRTEALCWEFKGAASGSGYLVYIDAETGEEMNVLKVVQSGGGTLTM